MNRTIKADYTLHEMKSIDIFLQTLDRAVKERSQKLSEPPSLEPQPEPSQMTAAQMVRIKLYTYVYVRTYTVAIATNIPSYILERSQNDYISMVYGTYCYNGLGIAKISNT